MGVVNHHEFGIERKSRAIAFGIREKNFEILRTCRIGRAVQGVVERFRDVKEIFAAGHHVPLEMEIQLFRERYQAIEDFRYAAANGRGIDHLDAVAAQRFRKCAQLFDFARAMEPGVVVQRDARESQRRAHAFLLSRSIRRSSLARALSSVFV